MTHCSRITTESRASLHRAQNKSVVVSLIWIIATTTIIFGGIVLADILPAILLH